MLISRLAESFFAGGGVSGMAKKLAGCAVEAIAGTTCPLFASGAPVGGIGALIAATRFVVASKPGGILPTPLPIGAVGKRLPATAPITFPLPLPDDPLPGAKTAGFTVGLAGVFTELATTEFVGLAASGAAR
jgi:hypothetical protein